MPFSASAGRLKDYMRFLGRFRSEVHLFGDSLDPDRPRDVSDQGSESQQLDAAAEAGVLLSAAGLEDRSLLHEFYLADRRQRDIGADQGVSEATISLRLKAAGHRCRERLTLGIPRNTNHETRDTVYQ